MSAFIVEDITINRIVGWFNVIAMAGSSHDDYWYLKRLLDMGYKLDTDLGCKRLAEEMFTLNCDSVEQRYGKGEAEKFRPLNFQYRFARPENRYQVLKCLRCFLYQCYEGMIPKQNSLYKALDRLSFELSYQIVSRSKQYELAGGWN
jgi:hypothetical protein